MTTSMSSRVDRGILGIIPARQASKGIAGKNLVELAGRPLVQHTLDAACSAKRLTWAMVTSDDLAVLQLGQTAGLRVLERPKDLATDSASMSEVVAHALLWAEDNIGKVDDIVLLQPTSPFRTATDIDEALAVYMSSKRESLISVCKVTQHPNECLVLGPDGEPHPVKLIGQSADSDGRHKYPTCYFIDGAIYITSVDRFRRTGSFADEQSALHEIPRSHGIDIDHPFDLAVARALAAYARTAPEVFTL